MSRKTVLEGQIQLRNASLVLWWRRGLRGKLGRIGTQSRTTSSKMRSNLRENRGDKQIYQVVKRSLCRFERLHGRTPRGTFGLAWKVLSALTSFARRNIQYLMWR